MQGIPAATREASGQALSRDRTVVSNVLVLVVGQPLTWSLTLLFLLFVPRTVGPAAWGELTLATAIGAGATVAIDLGLAQLLTKEVGRDRQRAADRVGAALALRAVLALVAFAAVITATRLAHLSPHLQLVVAVITLSSLTTSAVAPAFAALQGLERMIYSTTGAFVTSGLAMLGAIVVVRAFSAGVVGIALASLAAAFAGAGLQVYFLRRLMPIRPRLNLKLMTGLAMRGFPFYATALSFTIYAWADTILLAMFTPPAVVGWYGASTRLLLAAGFIPVAVTTAVFPALSLAHVQDRSGMTALAAKALVFVISLGVPFSVGLALVGPGIMHTLYGTSFDPAIPVLVILSFVLVPVFVATLVSSVLFASDRQVRWTVVMAVCCVVNIALNLLAIPYFQGVLQNGAVGAAVALLCTDTVVGIAALVLLPVDVLKGVVRHGRQLVMNAVATAGMAVAVWPLRSTFVVLPILVGLVVYGALAVALSVYDRRQLRLIGELTGDAGRRLRRVVDRSRPTVEAVAAGVAAGTEVTS